MSVYFVLDCMYKCTYNYKMKIEWDSKKAISNLKKHRINFADVVTVLEDESAITIHKNIMMRNDLLLSVWTLSIAFSLLSIHGMKTEFESYQQGKQQQKR